MHLCCFTLSCSSKPQRQLSFVFHSLYHVSLVFSLLVPLSSYIMLLCLALRALSCTFSYTSGLDLQFQLEHSNLMSTYKSCTFYCSFSCRFEFYICPYVLHLKSFVNQSYMLQPVLSLLLILYAMHLCLAPFKSNVLKFCLASLSKPMSCTFDLHL